MYIRTYTPYSAFHPVSGAARWRIVCMDYVIVCTVQYLAGLCIHSQDSLLNLIPRSAEYSTVHTVHTVRWGDMSTDWEYWVYSRTILRLILSKRCKVLESRSIGVYLWHATHSVGYKMILASPVIWLSPVMYSVLAPWILRRRTPLGYPIPILHEQSCSWSSWADYG